MLGWYFFGNASLVLISSSLTPLSYSHSPPVRQDVAIMSYEVRVTGVRKRPAGPEKDDTNDVIVERSEAVIK